jgi:hypothetical protein
MGGSNPPPNGEGRQATSQSEAYTWLLLSHAQAAADCVTAGFSDYWSAEAEAVALTCRHLLVWVGGKRKRKSCEANPALEGALTKVIPSGIKPSQKQSCLH